MNRPPRFKHARGTNLGAFEEYDIELPETGLLLLKGINEETGGGSGSGKSTLILGLNYPLGTCDVPATELQTWDCLTPPVATDTFIINDKVVEITRGKRFSLNIDGIEARGSAAQKEEEIDRLFGMDAEMRGALTYRGQKKPGLFLSKADAAKKEFLTKLLGLDTFETAMALGKANVEKWEREESMALAQIADLNARLDQEGPEPVIADFLAYLATVQADVDKFTGEVMELDVHISYIKGGAKRVYTQMIESRAPELKALRAELERLEGFCIARPAPTSEYLQASYMVTECGTRVDRMTADDVLRRRALDQQRWNLNHEIQARSLKAGGVNGVLADKDRLNAELKVLARDVCPTCSREWDRAQERRDEITLELDELETALIDFRLLNEGIEELKQEVEGLPKFEPNPMIEAMRKAQAVAQAQVAEERQKFESGFELKTMELEKQRAEKRAQVAQLEKEVEGTAVQARDNALGAQDSFREVRDQKWSLLQSAKEAVSAGRRTIADDELKLARVVRIKDQRAGIDVKLSEVRQELGAERDFLQLIGREGFLGAIFDEVLAEISEETNQVLASVANTRNCTIRFSTGEVTKKGTANREIVPVVTINGHKASLKFGPSGGMTSVIEMAVDLAVGHVISRRTGVTPGWLIMDEPFDGLGVVEKETCLEILTKYAQDRLVIVVDHATETQGLFTKKVEVRYKEGVSTLV